MFIDAISGVHRNQILIVIMSTVLYSIVRFAEAYGLWTKRRWALWISALSGGVYLPFEAYELWSKISWFHVLSALVNIAIMAYMAVLLRQSYKTRILLTPATSGRA